MKTLNIPKQFLRRGKLNATHKTCKGVMMCVNSQLHTRFCELGLCTQHERHKVALRVGTAHLSSVSSLNLQADTEQALWRRPATCTHRCPHRASHICVHPWPASLPVCLCLQPSFQIFCVTFPFPLQDKWTTHTPGIMLDARKTRWTWTWSPLQVPSNLVRDPVSYTNNYRGTWGETQVGKGT